MTPVPVARSRASVPSVACLQAAGRAAGLDAVGVAGVEPFLQARTALRDRRRRGLPEGLAFTFAKPERSTDPRATLPTARALVVAAQRYAEVGHRDPPPPPGPHGRVARVARSDHYARLRRALDALGAPLRAGGWRTVVLADGNHQVDRAAAHRAGLGWFGRSANLLLPGQGSWFVLGAVLTDAPLGAVLTDAPLGAVLTDGPLGAVLTDAPLPGAARVVPEGCGPCRLCSRACPTGAIVGPGVVDPGRCLSWLAQSPASFPRPLRRALGDRLYGCDDCQEVCPPNRGAARRAPTRSAPDDGPDRAPYVDVLELLEADDEVLMARFGHWYLPGRSPRALRRTALVVLGNTGDARHAHVRAVLGRYLRHPDPFLRAHAVWSAGALGVLAWAAGAATDPDAAVREEWAAWAEQARG